MAMVKPMSEPELPASYRGGGGGGSGNGEPDGARAGWPAEGGSGNGEPVRCPDAGAGGNGEELCEVG
jgi:hypothetical protein